MIIFTAGATVLFICLATAWSKRSTRDLLAKCVFIGMSIVGTVLTLQNMGYILTTN